jgi:nitric oxide dioxygenase
MSLDVESLEASFDLVAPRGEELVALFYVKLFERAPDLRALFRRVDMEQQRAMLLEILVLLRQSFRDLGPLVPKARALGARHVAYGATPELYPIVGDVLVESLAQVAGDAWTERNERAWTEAYELLASVMLEGAAEADEEAAA